VVPFIGTLWNLFSVVSQHQAKLRTNLDKIGQEGMVIISQLFLPQLPLLRRMITNRHYSKVQQSNLEMILVFYKSKMMDLSLCKMFHIRQKISFKIREVGVISLKCT
jgi:hypothetical protein